MKHILIPLFILLSKITFAQLDYKNIKDTICPSACGIRDIETLEGIYSKLLSLDTNQISNGLADYYADLSQVQYEICLRNKSDKAMLRQSLASAEKSLHHNPKNHDLLWNVAFYYKTLGDCSNALIYLQKYSQICPKRYWKQNKDQIELFLDSCPNDQLKEKFHIKNKPK